MGSEHLIEPATAAAVRHIRQLSVADAHAASAILLEAAAWSSERHAFLWAPHEISAARCEAWAQDALLFGGFDNAHMAAVFCLHEADTLNWPESAPGEALYLHKVAVRRSAVGTGWLADIIVFSIREAQRRRFPKLRLDTLANTPLVALYERHGFTRAYDTPLAVGDRMLDRLERTLS